MIDFLLTIPVSQVKVFVFGSKSLRKGFTNVPSWHWEKFFFWFFFHILRSNNQQLLINVWTFTLTYTILLSKSPLEVHFGGHRRVFGEAKTRMVSLICNSIVSSTESFSLLRHQRDCQRRLQRESNKSRKGRRRTCLKTFQCLNNFSLFYMKISARISSNHNLPINPKLYVSIRPLVINRKLFNQIRQKGKLSRYERTKETHKGLRIGTVWLNVLVFSIFGGATCYLDSRLTRNKLLRSQSEICFLFSQPHKCCRASRLSVRRMAWCTCGAWSTWRQTQWRRKLKSMRRLRRTVDGSLFPSTCEVPSGFIRIATTAAVHHPTRTTRFQVTWSFSSIRLISIKLFFHSLSIFP